MDTVSVRILDKEYQVACPPEERDALLRAAQELDERMRTIRNSANIIGLERIAVMAALNLSHELLSERNAPQTSGIDADALHKLNDKIDRSLSQLNG